MRQLEKFKEILAALDDPMEAALYIDKMREAAGYFCKERYPDEVILESDGQFQDISTYGVKRYLESEIDKWEGVE